VTEDLQPPTSLEASARALGADTEWYRSDYLMIRMRDGVRLATVVIRPKAAGAYPVLLVRTPYPATSLDNFGGLAKALFEKDYAVIIQNERGSQWSEGDFGVLTKTTSDGLDTLDWIVQQNWSNGRVGMYGCSSTAENQLKLAAIGHPARYRRHPRYRGFTGPVLPRRGANAGGLGPVARAQRHPDPT
jgi:predicted acyl esterase